MARSILPLVAALALGGVSALPYGRALTDSRPYPSPSPESQRAAVERAEAKRARKKAARLQRSKP